MDAQARRPMVVASTLYARDVGLRLASLKPRTCLLPLVRRQLRRPTEPHATLLRSHDPLATARADQLTLELGKAREHRDNQATVCVRGVSPSVAQRAEARTAFVDAGEQVEQVACRCAPGDPAA